ncbi:MAG: ribonuclease Z, partial [Oscillochloris sp.]|nr:ribonuclease Z [Oscillochloris sp.]
RLAGRTAPLSIYGLPATLQIVQKILEAFALDDYQPPIDWVDLVPGATIHLAEGWRLRTALTMHSRPCLALRFEEADGGRALAYSADTEPCPAVAALALGAAALIHEATTPRPFVGHTSPRQAGEVAAAAGVGQLVLVHYSPQRTMPEEQALAEVRAGGYLGPTEIGREYQVIML